MRIQFSRAVFVKQNHYLVLRLVFFFFPHSFLGPITIIQHEKFIQPHISTLFYTTRSNFKLRASVQSPGLLWFPRAQCAHPSFVQSVSRVQGLKDKVTVAPACGDLEPITAQVAETEGGHQGFPASVRSASWAPPFSAGDGPVNDRTSSRIAGLHH